MRYYNSYYLTEGNVLNGIEGVPFYLKVYFSPTLNCNVAERHDNKGEVYFIVYYIESINDVIKKYHADNYNNRHCAACKTLKTGILLSFYNPDFEIYRHLIQTYFTDGRLKLLQEFNSEFELLEYREQVYNNERRFIEDKIFYAESWTIHCEKVD